MEDGARDDSPAAAAVEEDGRSCRLAAEDGREDKGRHLCQRRGRWRELEEEEEEEEEVDEDEVVDDRLLVGIEDGFDDWDLVDNWVRRMTRLRLVAAGKQVELQKAARFRRGEWAQRVRRFHHVHRPAIESSRPYMELNGAMTFAV